MRDRLLRQGSGQDRGLSSSPLLRAYRRPGGNAMSVQMVLLPVFVLIGLAFALLLGMATMRTETLKSGETPIKDIALGQSNWPLRTTQIGNCFSNQFEVPVLFY